MSISSRPSTFLHILRTLRVLALASISSFFFSASLHAQLETAEEQMNQVEGSQLGADAGSLGEMTLEELMQHFGVPGISVAVIRDFEIHWAKGYGIADVETGAAVNTETLFQAGSISKPVAAMGTLRAVQDGLFELDDDINDILTSWTLDGGEFTRNQPVTPRTLTSHTSGLGDGFGYPGYDPSETIPTLVQTLNGHELSNVGPVFMERPPMTAMEYSGGGVSVMQQALTDARRRPFPELMHDHVLGPIGMKNSTYIQPLTAELDKNAARAHDSGGNSMGSKWHIYPAMAAAGLWSTASDLAKFAIEVQKSAMGNSNTVLSREKTLEMLTPVGVGSFAVGFSISKRGEGWYFSHNGADWGFQADLVAHKAKGYGFALMTNSDNGGSLIRELARRIEIAYQWDSIANRTPRGYAVAPADGGVNVDENVLQKYVGTFEFKDLVLAFKVVDGRLGVQLLGNERQTLLLAESDSSFYVPGFGVRVAFQPDETGEVNEAALERSGKCQPGRRLN